MKKHLFAGAASAALLLAGQAQAADPTPAERAINYRQGVMAVIGWNFGPMGAMVKGDRPFDKAVFARNAERVALMAPMALEGFPAGSDTGTDKFPTRAKADAWLDQDKFKELMKKMEDETARLARVAKGGDEKAMKDQFGTTAKACKACHDDFREK